MKALILKEPGEKPDIQVVDSPEPSLTSDGVIIKVGASGICHHDISVMDGTLRRGTKTDVILGHEISGTVVDVGVDVKDINLGENTLMDGLKDNLFLFYLKVCLQIQIAKNNGSQKNNFHIY